MIIGNKRLGLNGFGDRSTRFFHASVQAKRAQLRISKIKDFNGVWLHDQDALKAHAIDFYSNLFMEEGDVGSMDHTAAVQQFLSYIPPLISEADNASLLRPVELCEIREAVWRLDPDSAAGVDGFSGRFYQCCWDIIQADLRQAVQEFFLGVPVPRSVSSTLMVLLPKKLSPSHFGDFRPISLGNFVNKICPE